MLLNLPMLKMVRGYSYLVTLTRYAPRLPEQLPIMCPSETTDFDSSLTWNSHVHAISTQLSQGDIFFVIAKDLTGIGTLEETC